MAHETIKLTADLRETTGTRTARRLRAAGRVPAVIYGHKEAVVPVSLPMKETVTHINDGTHLFELTFGGTNQNVLLKDVQFDHLGKEIIHIDLTRVSLDERVNVVVPIEIKGTPVGEEKDGVLTQVLTEIEVECLVTQIPESVIVDVTPLDVDDTFTVGDLKLPEGVIAQQEPDIVIASVSIVQEIEEDVESTSAEPEVIGAKVDGEEEAEEK